MSNKKRKRELEEDITENRWVIEIGASYFLNPPPEFVVNNYIVLGEKVQITTDHILKVIPHSERRAHDNLIPLRS